MNKHLCRAVAPVLLLGFAASPALAMHLPMGGRYIQFSGSRSASASVPQRKVHRDVKVERRERTDCAAWPEWHELLARIF
jgi:hypothetical protein